MGNYTPRVIICWMSNHDTIMSLAYNNGEGVVRVYPKNQYDGRLNLGRASLLPYFDSPKEAYAWMKGNPDAQCQCNTKIAPALGWERSELDL